MTEEQLVAELFLIDPSLKRLFHLFGQPLISSQIPSARVEVASLRQRR